MGRHRDRTFTGCWTCRRRRVKCDETKPTCRACQRVGSTCSGYEAKLVWVDHEGQLPASCGRSALRCDSTWKGYPTLSSDIVDLLIESCDGDDATCWNSTQMRRLKQMYHSPFSIFSTEPTFESTNGSSDIEGVEPEPEPTPVAHRPYIQAITSLSPLPDLSSRERGLFHHYVSYVAGMMIPYEHPRNVWKTDYPMIALSQSTANQRALYNAIISQAAFSMAYLRKNDPKLLFCASKYYNQALHQLQLQLISRSGTFLRMLKPIMALLFAEIFNGQSRAWRYHFQGAWTLLREYYLLEPWKDTDSVSVSIQSLTIIRTIGGTSTPQLALDYEGPMRRSNMDPTDTRILSSVFQTPDFGFTIGASPEILKCIAEISQYRWAKDTKDHERSKNRLLAQILLVLNKHETHASRKWDEENGCKDGSDGLQSPGLERYLSREGLQRDAFVHATHIYLYRTLLQTPPASVEEHASQIFSCISTYHQLERNSNFSLWPAFIAAVEAYTDEQMALAREWLDWATSLGIAGRNVIRRIVEEVWSRRNEISKCCGYDRGMIAIDWIDVMHDLDADALLI